MMSELLSRKLDRLAVLEVGKVRFGELLSHHSSWQIGGAADLFIEPETVGQVAEIINFTRRNAIPMVVIGQGTNLLFADTGVRGVVVKIGAAMADLQISGQTITAAAGVWVPRLVRRAQQEGFIGLEHCIGIPGTIGGLVLMNGGSSHRGIGENV